MDILLRGCGGNPLRNCSNFSGHYAPDHFDEWPDQYREFPGIQTVRDVHEVPVLKIQSHLPEIDRDRAMAALRTVRR